MVVEGGGEEGVDCEGVLFEKERRRGWAGEMRGRLAAIPCGFGRGSASRERTRKRTRWGRRRGWAAGCGEGEPGVEG